MASSKSLIEFYKEIVNYLFQFGQGETDNYVECRPALPFSIEFNGFSALNAAIQENTLETYYSHELGLNWRQKQVEEEMHYVKLEGTLLHAINENKFYLKESVFKSRRFVAFSTDCISMIHLLFREASTQMNVYLRSSEAAMLLLPDLDFLIKLIAKAISYIISRAGDPLYNEIGSHEKSSLLANSIHINLQFGSLHTYNMHLLKQHSL